MGAHSDVVGGSNCDRVIECPGSVALIKTLPRGDNSSDFADEGTMLHEVWENILTEDSGSMDMIGYEYKEQVLDLDHVTEAIDPGLAYFDEICDKFNIDMYECEVKADWESVIPGAFGAIDVLASGKTHNVIWDWKGGKGVPVSALGNRQLRFYAAGAMLNEKLQSLFNPALPTVLVICQPRIEDGNSYEIVDTAELLEFVRTVQSAVRRSKKADAELNTGSHCRWCNAKPICPKKVGVARTATTIDPAFTDPGELAELLDLAEEVADWAKSLQQFAHADAENGAPIPGWKLVAKRANRKWTDDVAAAKRFRGMKLRVMDIFEHKLRSPAQLEKIIKAKGKNVGVVKDLCGSNSTGTVLAREYDKRPAVLAFGNAKRNLQNSTGK